MTLHYPPVDLDDAVICEQLQGDEQQPDDDGHYLAHFLECITAGETGQCPERDLLQVRRDRLQVRSFHSCEITTRAVTERASPDTHTDVRYHCRVNIRIAPRIATALQDRQPVVALESTVITHGLPRPDNLELARSVEAVIRDQGAEPATIGILDGEAVIGLSETETEALAGAEADKASLWNLAAIMQQGRSAGTTVAATQYFAARAGITVFATGGIGGVHHFVLQHEFLSAPQLFGPQPVQDDCPLTNQRQQRLGRSGGGRQNEAERQMRTGLVFNHGWTRIGLTTLRLNTTPPKLDLISPSPRFSA